MVKNSVVRFFGTVCTKGIFYISWHANVLTNDSDAILPFSFPTSEYTQTNDLSNDRREIVGSLTAMLRHVQAILNVIKLRII